jgi:putative cell wall-binding protein
VRLGYGADVVAVARHLNPRPALLVIGGVLAVVAVTAPLAAILDDEPSVGAAVVGLVAGLASLGLATTRDSGGDTIRLFGAAGAMLAVPAALLALAPTLGADVSRLAGDDRVATAIAVSAHAYDRADAVVLVDAGSSTDAVAAAPLASQVEGPLLLQGDGVAEEIQRLGATRAYLVGAAAASEDVEGRLERAGVTEVVRLAGADGSATSAAVASRLRPDRVYVTSSWADAIAVTPLAAEGGALLTIPGDAVPASTVRALQRIGPDEVVVVGGRAAVESDVLTFLEALLPDAAVSRLAGTDRWETSLEVFHESGMSGDRPWIASGSSWPDALAAATGAAAEGRPLLLVPSSGSSPSAETSRWLQQHRGDIRSLTVVGGEEAVPARFVDRLTDR